MIQHPQKISGRAWPTCWLTLLLGCALSNAVSAQQVVLYLKSGDKITGLILSESPTQVVISNAWIKTLSIPSTEISCRKLEKSAEVPPAAISPPAQPILAARAKPKGTWQGEARLGLDAIISTTDQQNYSGHLKYTYEQPYDSNPKKVFKNTSELDGGYQRTDGQESANQVSAQNKSDFDIGKKSYGYGLFGAGHDYVQKINYQYQVGPGGGVHLIKQSDFAMNIEGGLDYEAQFRRDAANLETFYLRLAEDFTWKIDRNLSLTQKLAFYPDVEHQDQFRNEFESTLSYAFWKNLSINLTALDHYNTEVVAAVDENLFEIRSSLGIKF
jgi:putative salt-induced outer membrane protein YdiY